MAGRARTSLVRLQAMAPATGNNSTATRADGGATGRARELLAQSEATLARDPAAALTLAREAATALAAATDSGAAPDSVALAARIACQSGAASIWLGQYGDAINTLRGALALAQAAEADDALARCHNNLGVASMKLGDAVTALDHFDRALELRRQLNDRAGQAATLHNIGIQRRELGDLAGARDAYEQTLVFDRETGDRLGEGRTLMSIGVLAFQQQRMDEAAQLFGQAVALAAANNDLISLARGYENIASIAIEAGRIDTALADVERGLAAADQLGNPEVHADLHATRGKALRVSGRSAEALQAFALASGLLGDAHNKRLAIELDCEISLAREAEGDLAGALQAVRRAFVREREVNTEDARRRLEAIAFRQEVERAQTRAARFERLAHEDELTAVGNRRWLELKLRELSDPALLALSPLSVVLLDIDHFKRINDRLSHAAGDQVLRLFAALLREHCRGQDVAARYGGEEFALLLPHTPLAAARDIAERVRAAVEQHDWSAVHRELAVTLSAGVASASTAAQASDIVTRADAALYRAKAAGRNRIESTA